MGRNRKTIVHLDHPDEAFLALLSKTAPFQLVGALLLAVARPRAFGRHDLSQF